MKGFAHSVAAVVLCAASLAHADDVADKQHQAVMFALAAKPCLPPASFVNGEGETYLAYRITLGEEQGAVVACASRGEGHVADGPPLACWSIDETTGALTEVKPTVFPGMSFTVPSACAYGYCRAKQRPPKKIPAGQREIVAFSNDGTRVATTDVASDTIGVFDVRTKKLQHQFAMEGFGYEPQDLVFMNDMVFATGTAAASKREVVRWNASDGTPLEPLGVNIFAGSYGAIDATHFAVDDGGFHEVVIDTTTGGKSARSLPRPKACSQEAFDAYFAHEVSEASDDSPVPAKCEKAIEKAQRTFWKPRPLAGYWEIGEAMYKLEHGDTTSTLLVLDKGAKKPRTVGLPVCKVR